MQALYRTYSGVFFPFPLAKILHRPVSAIFSRSICIERKIVTDNPLTERSCIDLKKDRKLVIGREIGKGAYNTIYRAELVSSTDTKVVAARLARWPKTTLDPKNPIENGQLEVKRLPVRLYMEQQIRILTFFQDKQMEHVDCKLVEPVLVDSPDGLLTIREIMKGDIITCLPKITSLHQLLKLLSQACLGLDELHKNCSVSHNDIKPHNILINMEGNAVIGDMDLAEFMQENWPGIGSKAFTDPYWEEGEPMTSAFDIYSMGRSIFYLLLAKKWNASKDMLLKVNEVARQAISFSRTDRPSARQMAVRLDSIANG